MRLASNLLCCKQLLDRQDDDVVGPVTAFFQPQLRNAYNVYTAIKKATTPQMKKFLREFVRFADTVYLQDAHNFSSMVFMASTDYYVNADTDHAPADIPADAPADNKADPANVPLPDGNDLSTQTHKVDPTPTDPTINHNHGGSIHQVSLDSEGPNDSHKKPSNTTALKTSISSKVDAMTHKNHSFQNETHLSVHSTDLPTAHGKFDSTSSIPIPTPRITISDRDSKILPTTSGTASLTSAQDLKLPAADKGIMDILSPDHSSRSRLGHIADRFSSMNQNLLCNLTNKNPIDNVPSPESPTDPEASHVDSPDTLHPLDQLARDKSTIAGWNQIQTSQDVSDITLAGPSHSNDTTELPKEPEDALDPTPDQDNVVIDLSSPDIQPTSDTSILPTTPGLQVAMMNSIISEIISSERTTDPRPHLTDTDILVAHITHHYPDNALVQTYSRDFHGTLDLADKCFAFYRLRYFFIAHLLRCPIMDSRHMNEDARVHFLDKMIDSLAHRKEFHLLYDNLMAAPTDAICTRIFNDIILMRYGIPMVHGPRLRSPPPKFSSTTLTQHHTAPPEPQPRPDTPRPPSLGKRLSFAPGLHDVPRGASFSGRPTQPPA